MTGASITIQGLDELLRDLNQPLEPVLRNMTFAIGQTLVIPEMAQSAPRANSPVIWASEKSRRYYFWMRRKKNLPLGYTRESDPMSQDIKKKWTISHLGQTDATVTSGATYGPFVQSASMQTAQHKATGWITDERGVANVERSGDVERVAQQVIAKQTAFKD